MCALLVIILNSDLPWVLAAVFFNLSIYLSDYLVVKLWGIQQIPILYFGLFEVPIFEHAYFSTSAQVFLGS